MVKTEVLAHQESMCVVIPVETTKNQPCADAARIEGPKVLTELEELTTRVI